MDQEANGWRRRRFGVFATFDPSAFSPTEQGAIGEGAVLYGTTDSLARRAGPGWNQPSKGFARRHAPNALR